MKPKALLRLLFLCCSLPATAQALRLPPSSLYPKLTGYSSLQADAFSFAANSAALASLKKFSVATYGERRFLLQDLTFYSLALVLPAAGGSFGLRADLFGGSLYRETSCTLAYARSLGERLKSGVQFHLYHINMPGYGRASAITAEAGFLYRLADQWSLGFNAYNPAGVWLGKNRAERLPAVYSLGLGFDPSGKLYMGFELCKEESQPVDFRAGLQYAFHERFLARAGLASSSSTFCLGAGIRLGLLRVDATASLHPQAGLTPGFLIHYPFNQGQ
ncbi:MAG TPA: hypothetical protein VGB46_11620 [Flavisolibacter sp.]|jgi:hypothetical protein